MTTKIWIATAALAAATTLPLTAQVSQSTHDRHEREQIRSDHRHHTGAKIIGGSAVGGAVVGGVLGGGKGALIGGAVGAGGGALANHARKENDVKKADQRSAERYPR